MLQHIGMEVDQCKISPSPLGDSTGIETQRSSSIDRGHVKQPSIDGAVSINPGPSALATKSMGQFKEPKLLEHGDPGIGVAADANLFGLLLQHLDRRQTVAEIRFRQRTETHVASSRKELAQFIGRRVCIVHCGERGIQLQAVQQESCWRASTGRTARLNLSHLLLNVHVETAAA